MENHIQGPASAANIVNSEVVRQTGHQPDEIICNGVIYRIDEQAFQKQLLINALVCVGWTGVIVICFMMGFIDLTNLDIPTALLPICGAAMCSLSLSIISIINCKTLPPPLTFSLSAAALYLTFAAILLGLSIPLQWIAAVLFAIAQIIICLMFLQNKRNVILVVLAGLQLVLVALKVDRILTAQWATVFIIFIIAGATMMFAALVLAIYGFALRIKGGRFTADIIGVLYQAVFQLGVGLCVATVVSRVAFLSTSIYVGAPCMAFHIYAILRFMYPFRQQIAIYKSQGQIVSIVARQSSICKIQKQTTLYQLSSQWYTLDQSKLCQNKASSSSEDKENQCAVCLSQMADLVWIPCGHLNMCLSCGEYMLQINKLDCVMCKAKGKQIYHVSQKSNCVDNSTVSDYHYQISLI